MTIDPMAAYLIVCGAIAIFCVGAAWGRWFAARQYHHERALMRECLDDWNDVLARASHGHHINQRVRTGVSRKVRAPVPNTGLSRAH